MPGRPMRGYLSLPATLRDAPEAVRPWLDRAREHVLSMPPKKGR